MFFFPSFFMKIGRKMYNGNKTQTDELGLKKIPEFDFFGMNL